MDPLFLQFDDDQDERARAAWSAVDSIERVITPDGFKKRRGVLCAIF